MLKKLAYLLIVSFLVLSACGTSKLDEKADNEETVVEEETTEENATTDEEVNEEIIEDENEITEEVNSDETIEEEITETEEEVDGNNISFIPQEGKYTYDNGYAINTNIFRLTNEYDDLFVRSVEILDEINGTEVSTSSYWFEDVEGLHQSIGMEYTTKLAYPIEVGKTWESYGGEEILTIEAVDVTVETNYQTFTNAVKVSSSWNYDAYYVPGYGLVKAEMYHDDEVKVELLDVELFE